MGKPRKSEITSPAGTVNVVPLAAQVRATGVSTTGPAPPTPPPPPVPAPAPALLPAPPPPAPPVPPPQLVPTTQLPEQKIWPLGQPHTPAVHAWPPAHWVL